MHFSHSAAELSIISKSVLTESQSNFRSIFENGILMSDVLSPRWPGPRARGCRGGGRKQTSIRHLGEHGQCGQQDGKHRANGQDTGQLLYCAVFVLYETMFKWDSI